MSGGGLHNLLDQVAVEWMELGRVGHFVRGKRFVKTDIMPTGVPCIHYGELYTHYGISANKSKSFLDPELAQNLRHARHGDVIIVSAGETIEDIGNGTAWLGERDVVIHDACFAYRSELNPAYVSHFLRTTLFKEQIRKYVSSGKISSINSNGLGNARIPIPCPDNPQKSLAVQAEIVRILDASTELTARLIAELTAELAARKRQYKHYRDQLLRFEDSSVNWKSLGDEELFEISSGGTPSKGKSEYWTDGNIPWIKSESCNNKPVHSAKHFITTLGLKKSSAKLLQEETTLIALVGATIFKTAFLEFPAATNQNIASIKSRNTAVINDKFVFYFMTSLYDKLRSEVRNYGMLNLTSLRQFKVPVPSSEEQTRIVAILDKFEALINLISEQLPREIELRRKQYAHYRDLLLSFPRPEEVEG